MTLDEKLKAAQCLTQAELRRVTAKAMLPACKQNAIEAGDLEWLRDLHEIERRYAES